MFSKAQRLAKKKEIEAVFASKKSTYSKILGLKYTENNLDYSRYTVIISKKVEKTAVGRNKIKRIIKNNLKEIDSKLKKNLDCVIICQKEIVKKDSQEIKKELLEVYKRLKLI